MDFNFDHLDGEARKIAEIIYEHLKKELKREPYGGGCKAFHSQEEWKARNELYGKQALLVLVYDGGDLAPFVEYNYERYHLIDGLNKTLTCAGYYIEPCTNWYAAVYSGELREEK